MHISKLPAFSLLVKLVLLNQSNHQIQISWKLKESIFSWESLHSPACFLLCVSEVALPISVKLAELIDKGGPKSKIPLSLNSLHFWKPTQQLSGLHAKEGWREWHISNFITPIQIMLGKCQLRKRTKANFGNFCLTEFQPPEGLFFDSSSWFLAPANSIWIRVAHWGSSDCAYEQHSLGQDFSDLLMAGSQFKYVTPSS